MNRTRTLILPILLISILLPILMLSCGQKAEPEARVLMIGLDGIEMSVLKPLLAKGDLPNMARLIDRGVIGYLQTFEPTYSPVVWTSIATGKSPTQHRIQGFLDVNSGGPYTSNARKGKAIWNIIGDYGLKCNVTGYWITWPAEKINGVMISQVSTKEQYDDIWKGMLYKGVKDSTYPPEFIDEIWPVVEPFQTPEFLKTKALPQVFGSFDDLNPSLEVEKLITDSNWSFAGDCVYSEAGKYLLEHYPADLDIVYLGGTDVIGHRFWRYRQPELYTYGDKIAKRYLKAFGDAIDNYYKTADRMVGEMLELVPEDTRVIICSDHGMHPDFLDGTDKGKKTILSAHHLDAPPGFFIAAGSGIKKGPGLKAFLDEEQVDVVGTVFDVTPTLLYLLDIPVGRDMKSGKVMKSILSEDLLNARLPESIESHDVDFRPPGFSRSSQQGDRAFIERFQELGYIDAGATPETPEFKMGKGPKE